MASIKHGNISFNADVVKGMKKEDFLKTFASLLHVQRKDSKGNTVTVVKYDGDKAFADVTKQLKETE